MAKLDFPGSPYNGQQFEQNGVYYSYDGAIGAWVTALTTKPYDKSINKQIIFNDATFANGSHGMLFDKASNTAFFNNVAVTLNVSATYFKGNGAFLTGVASDLSPAYNTANAAFTVANAAFGNANATLVVASAGFTVANAAFGNANATLVVASAAFNAANNAGVSVTNDTLSTSTFYPVFTTTTSGAAKANVANTKLYFVPSTGTLSATVFNSLSDIRFKTDIQEFDGIELLNNVNPISFKWKDTGVRSYGVIAQELEQTLPELVETNDQGIKSVSYMPMIAMLIDVVKKQQKEIDKLKTLLNTK